MEALVSAKSQKQVKLEYARADELRKQKAKELFEPFDKDKLAAFCQSFYFERLKKEFIVDDSNRLLYNKLLQYFTGDKDFENGGYSLQKGILILGNVGVGKTEIMRFFQKNKKSCFVIKSCHEIADDYMLYENEINEVYSTPIERAMNDPDVFFQKYIGYCFDDLGTEEVKNNYGNKKNVMADILLTIYEKKEYSKFHMTTNLQPEEIEQMYGTRVRSRIREMFNVFTLNGKDRRL